MTALLVSLLTLASRPADAPLTSVAEVRGYFRHDASTPSRAVRLRDVVVTYRSAEFSFIYVQDKAQGVQVRVPAGQWPNWVAVGDVVHVTGETHDGDLVHAVRGTKVEAAGRREKPEPAPFDMSRARAEWLDGRFVMVRGKVRNRQVVGGVTNVVLIRDGHEVTAVYSGRALPAGVSAGALVVVNGVCATEYTRNRGAEKPARILVADAGAIDVHAAGPPSAFGSALVTAAGVRELGSLSGEGRDLVRVTGVLTGRLGAKVFVQDASGAVAVNLADGQTAPEPGKLVDVVGTPATIGGGYGLGDGEIRAAGGPSPPVAPLAVPPEQLADEAFRARLVRVEGTVLDVSFTANRLRLTVFGRGHFAEAFLESPGSLGGVVPGSRVTLTGVCDTDRAGGAVIVLRTADDVRVTGGPPFWTAERGWALLGGFGAMCALGAVGMLALRGQVRRAAAQIERQFAEREKLRAQFEAAARMEVAGRIAGGVAHEFNNLLTVINGCATLLAESLDEGQPADLAGDIKQAGERAAVLTGNLLNVSRPKPVVPQPMDLNAVVRETAHLLGRTIGDHVAIRTEPDVGLPVVKGDAGLVLQILFNLILNARDAMPDGGTVVVRTAAVVENGVTWARLSVTDTGTGMPPAVQAQIFEPFFTTKDVGKGTGLGLHHVRTHVGLLNGRVRCASEVGRGTTFEIDLPTTASVADDMTPLPPPLVAPTPLSGDYSTVVLVVDDEEGVRALAQRILELRGMTVLAAGDADTAARAADAHPGRIDILLTDLLLPSCGGRELAERLRARRPGLRVVYMSGLSAENAAEQGLVDATAAFVQKPFKPASLHAAVMRAMGVAAG